MSSSPTNNAETSGAATTDQLSDAQQQVLALLTVVSATCSILGSAQIIVMVVSSRQKTPYRRILLGLSLCDVWFSLDLALQAFLLPRDDYASFGWAVGNGTTCTVMGFVLQFGFSAILYNAVLSVYFLLTVKFGIRDDVMAARYEPCFHCFCIGFGVITAFVGLGLQAYKPRELGLRCWINQENRYLAWILGGVPTCLAFFVILFNNLLVYCHVRRTIHQSRQSATDPSIVRKTSNTTTGTGTTGTGTTVVQQQQQQDMLLMVMMTSDHPNAADDIHQHASSNNNRENDDTNYDYASTIDHHHRRKHKADDTQQKRIQAVATQAFCYVASYFIANVFSVLQTSIAGYVTQNQVKAYPMIVITAIMFPSQGLLNMLVYARPSYLRARREFPTESKLWALRRALYGDRVVASKPHLQQGIQTSSSLPHHHLQRQRPSTMSRQSRWKFDSHLFFLSCRSPRDTSHRLGFSPPESSVPAVEMEGESAVSRPFQSIVSFLSNDESEGSGLPSFESHVLDAESGADEEEEIGNAITVVHEDREHHHGEREMESPT